MWYILCKIYKLVKKKETTSNVTISNNVQIHIEGSSEGLNNQEEEETWVEVGTEGFNNEEEEEAYEDETWVKLEGFRILCEYDEYGGICWKVSNA